MSDPIAPSGGSTSGPLAPTARNATGLVTRIGERIADELDARGWDGLSDKARRNLFATGFSAIGCGAFLALGLVLVVLNAAGMVGKSNVGAAQAAIVAPVAVTVDPLALQPGESHYLIVRGDVLGTIAQAKGVTLEGLRIRNTALLTEWREACEEATTRDPSTCVDTIRRGKKLVIPATSAEPPTSPAQ